MRLKKAPNSAMLAASSTRNGFRMLQPFDMVIFGGTGDLAMRKLLPALYYRHRDGELQEHGRIIGVAREELRREHFLTRVADNCRRFVSVADFDEKTSESFAARLDY